MSAVVFELRYAVRMLARSPGFAATAALTLALGIGATTTLFSIVNGVLLNPLRYPRADQVVALYGRTPGYDHAPVSYLNFLDWQRDTRTLSSMSLYRNEDYNLTGRGEGQRLSGYMVSADFFSTLQVTPVLGRTFRPEDDRLGAAPVAILGGGLWTRTFGSSPDVVGQAMTLNGASYTIVGVVPADFGFYGNSRDVYTPIGQWDDPSFRDRRIVMSAYAVGRLRTDVTLAQAAADMDGVARNLATAFPEADTASGITLVSMKEDIVGSVRPFLLVLLAAGGFVLLIACANVASLLLARATARSREFVVRAALGASQARVVRQLLIESLVLATCGGALGVWFAIGATSLVLVTLPGTLPRAGEVAVDGRALLFALGLTLGTGVVFGLAPALRTSRVNLLTLINEGGRGSSGVRHHMERLFAATEIAVALVLLVGAGLMVRSLGALWRVDQGFNPSHAITFTLSMPATRATTAEETRARLREVDDGLRRVPGVDAVSVTLGSRPMIHDSSLPFWIVGQPKPVNDNDMPQALFYLVEAGFRDAMGVTLERGRFISEHDDEHAPVAIDVDDVFARTYFPHEDPIGRRVHLEQFAVEAEIVGVVGHVKQWGPAGDARSAIQAQFYYPFMQLPPPLMPLAAKAVAVVVRASGDPAAVMGPVRRAVEQLDPRMVVYNASTLEAVVSSSLGARRVSMMLLTVFAALAVLLACVGIYGVVSYVIGQRTHEIGVRMAMGADRRDILRLVVGFGFRIALAGSVVGVVAAAGLTRLMVNQLFGVSAYDPLTFSGVATFLILVALAACYLPARRAMRVDPIDALRAE
jgi:predicted permease